MEVVAGPRPAVPVPPQAKGPNLLDNAKAEKEKFLAEMNRKKNQKKILPQKIS